MKEQTTEIWRLYQKGVDQHNAVNMYAETEKAHNFYLGEQWAGAKTGGEELPILNFIKPVVKYKTNMIAQNKMSIVYGSLSRDPEAQRLCELLTHYASAQWEKLRMDTLSFEMIKNCAVAGDHYAYCFDQRQPKGGVASDKRPKLKMRLIDKTNVYFSDEQNPDINEQEWIIISERLPVSKIKRTAKKNGLSAREIELISSDDDTADDLGQNSSRELKSDDGKCTSLLFMKLTDEGLSFCRSVKGAVYQKETTVLGLMRYPLCSMRWEQKKGDSRGVSAVRYMIPNQIEVNRTAARRAIAVKRFAFPTLAYDDGRVSNIDKLDSAGAKIAIKDMGQNPPNSFISFLDPPSASPDAASLQAELIERTQTLEGAGEAALGQVNPENASGESIKAARDQAATPLAEQVTAYRQFVEDIATMWLALWTAYSPDGLEITADGTSEVISKKKLAELEVDIRIDVCPVDPYSKLSRELALERLMESGKITFEEYVDSLSYDSATPKAKLKSILETRPIETEGVQNDQIDVG